MSVAIHAPLGMLWDCLLRMPFTLSSRDGREMVGTTRFELATSPTPRVRSTRLSHVPTCYGCAGQKARAG